MGGRPRARKFKRAVYAARRKAARPAAVVFGEKGCLFKGPRVVGRGGLELLVDRGDLSLQAVESSAGSPRPWYSTDPGARSPPACCGRPPRTGQRPGTACRTSSTSPAPPARSSVASVTSGRSSSSARLNPGRGASPSSGPDRRHHPADAPRPRTRRPRHPRGLPHRSRHRAVPPHPARPRPRRSRRRAADLGLRPHGRHRGRPNHVRPTPRRDRTTHADHHPALTPRSAARARDAGAVQHGPVGGHECQSRASGAKRDPQRPVALIVTEGDAPI